MVWAAPAPAAITLCLRLSAAVVTAAAAAALVLGAALAAAEQHADRSAPVPPGFPCVPAGHPPAATVLALTRGLHNRPVELSRAQLSCLARLLAAKNLRAHFDRYPPDLLLFFDLAKVRGETCRELYARALELLPGGLARQTGLLWGALACLGVRSSRLRPEQLSGLGGCDVEPETIVASAPGILESLKLCPALMGSQQDALNAVLLRGGTVYGDPSSWDLRTLQNLGPLVLALNQTTLGLVPEAAREALSRSLVAAYGSWGRSQQEKSLPLLRAFVAPSASNGPRLKRSTDPCPSVPITASTVSDPLLIIYYTSSEEFELCLSNEVLKANLEPLLNQPLPQDFQLVVKTKLGQIYPSGIPEEQLKLLGPLLYLYREEEICSWPLTSSDTLLALLSSWDGNQEAPQVQQLLSRYLALGGTLTGPLLQKIGGRNLCKLQEEQLEHIPPESIRTAGQLNISSCSQPKKDQLYRKAQEAFAAPAGITRAYYCQIWPYLGGAPANDLKALAEAGVAIDMGVDTFLALNPDELQKLSVMDVKNLLGKNLPGLKGAENETLVMGWVQRQSQQELDCVLGIGLHGGTTAAPHPPTPATSPTPTTLPTPRSSTAPPEVPTPSAASPGTPSPHPPLPSAAVPPTGTPTTQPAPGSTPSVPCSSHQCATSSRVTPPTVTLLPTSLATASPNAISPSSIPPLALTREATTTTSGSSTSLVSISPPAPGGTTHPAPATHNTHTPSTHSSPGTLVPNSTSSLVSTSPPAPTFTTHPTPATHNTVTLSSPGTLVPNSTSTLVSMSPPVPGATTHPAPATHNTHTPSSHSSPGTLVPNSTSSLVSTSPPAPVSTTHNTVTTPSTHSPPGTFVPNSTSSLGSTSPPAPGGTTHPTPATHNTVTSSSPGTLVPCFTSTLVSMSPPAPGGTTHPAPATHNTHTPSTHSSPGTLVPNSTSSLVSTSPPAPGGTTHPTPATHNTVTSSSPGTLVPSFTSTLVSMSPPVPGGTTHPTPATHNTHTPSTHSSPGTLVPNSTSSLVSTSPPAPGGTTHNTVTTPSTHSPLGTLVPNSTSTLVSMSPPVPGGTTHPTPATHNTHTLSTHSSLGTLVPNSTSSLVSTSPPAPTFTTHPAPATHNTVTLSSPGTLVPNSTSSLVSTSPPAPGATTHPAPATHNTHTPSTHSSPGTLVPNSTSSLVSTSPPAPVSTTHNTVTTPSTHSPPGTLVPNSTSSLGSTSPPAPGGTTPATHNTVTPSSPGTLVPSSTSVPLTAATEMNLPPHKSTPIPSSTISTQENVVSSTAKTTTLACKTGTSPAFLGPSSTTTSSETTKETPPGVPESPRPTQNGYINLQPEAGSGSWLSSCLLHVVATALGSSLLPVLL